MRHNLMETFDAACLARKRQSGFPDGGRTRTSGGLIGLFVKYSGRTGGLAKVFHSGSCRFGSGTVSLFQLALAHYLIKWVMEDPKARSMRYRDFNPLVDIGAITGSNHDLLKLRVIR